MTIINFRLSVGRPPGLALVSALCAALIAASAGPSSAATDPIASMPGVNMTGGKSMAPTAPSADYRLRPGDEIALNVYGEADLSRPDLVIDSGGRVGVGMVGAVPVAGMTSDQAGKAIANRLHAYLKSPVVSVALLKEAPLAVLVLGNVAKPNKYLLDPSSRVTDAIAAAQGLGPSDGDYPDARLSTPSGLQTTVSLQKLLREGDTGQNLPLTDGMTVYVPSPQTFNILVQGAVEHPGEVPIHPGDRLSIALARAGVGGNSEPDLNRVMVRHVGPDGKETQQTVNLYDIYNSKDISKDVVLQKGDLVVVPAEPKQHDRVSGPSSIIYAIGHVFGVL